MSGDGWTAVDIGRTAVISDGINFLLTSYVDKAHMEAVAVIQGRHIIERISGTWYLLELGVQDGKVSIGKHVCSTNGVLIPGYWFNRPVS